MDKKTEEILNDWGLASLVGVFKDNFIDYGEFQLLSDRQISLLFASNIGALGKFERKYASFKANGATSSQANAGPQLIVQNGNNVGDVGSVQLVKGPTEEVQEVYEVFQVATIETPATSNGVEKNVVDEYLDVNVVGKYLKSFGLKKLLNHAAQLKLAEHVVTCELKGDPMNSISPARFAKLASDIVELFPCEQKEVYYIPRKPGTAYSKPEQPKGVLYDKYHCLLANLRKAGLRRSIRGGNIEDDSEIIDYGDNNEAIRQGIEWLKQCDGPKQVVTSKWENTVAFRLLELKSKPSKQKKGKLDQTAVEDYINRYPCLKQSWGLELLVSDFMHIYGEQYTPLIDNWPTVCSKILRLSRSADEIGPSDVVKCLKLIPSLFNQPILVFNTKEAGKTVKRTWKPTGAESQQGFLLHVNRIEDLSVAIERMKIKCLEVNKTLQPFPVVIGPEDNITASYVIIDEQLYEVESPLSGLDFCFKAVHALHAQYPFQSSYAWQFVQEAIYNFETVWDISAPSISTKVKAYQSLPQ